MKKFILTAFITLLIIVLIPVSLVFGYMIFSPTRDIDENKLCKNSLSVEVYDCNNIEIKGLSFKGEKADVKELPSYIKNAFIAVEDKRFYQHNGIDKRAILRAFFNNVKSFSFKEGGSTITQQLIKDTHLSSEKTLKRKLDEIKLAKLMEKTHTKEEILSYYLNGVYFGNGAYGIENASKTYFKKSAKDLTLSEACSLAGTINAPSIFNPYKEKCVKRRNLVLKLMEEQGYIDNNQREKAQNEAINVVKSQETSGYFENILKWTFEHTNISPYENNKIKIYTYLDENCQKILEHDLKNVEGGGIIMSPQGKIKACFMPLGDEKRQPASTIKPLLVYAPAFEEGIIAPATLILDEKCDFGGWTPKNYGDVYNGYVDVDSSIYNSLNIPAIKVLSSVGIKKAKSYMQKMGFYTEKEDLSLALGSLENGVTLTELTGYYNVFANYGKYTQPQFIKEIHKNGKKIYEDKEKSTDVFSKGSVELVNNSLENCTFKGTAKAIGKRNYQICAKTGTCGTEKGNSDSWTIAYTSQDVIGIWLGKEKGLIDNNITGATASRYVSGILNDLYKSDTPSDFEKSGEVENVKLCKLAYEHMKIQKAVDCAPEKFSFNSPMLKKFSKNLKISDYFLPKITNYKVEIVENKINISVEKNKHVEFEVVKVWENGSEKVIDTRNDKVIISTDKDGLYSFILIPYTFDKDNNKIYGEKIFIPEIRININDKIIKKNWWEQ